jgi:hypothetical protein
MRRIVWRLEPKKRIKRKKRMKREKRTRIGRTRNLKKRNFTHGLSKYAMVG